ncbi:hypothetical protein PS273GM_09760 [Stutzerimonas stutzeri]|uniref:Uncharacterized protein n=1 Tax=Stutzerimonas stutzeri TaxID=316 RepID=A0A172WPL7_STUST|nr:hypothetical protein PS273GM_09760 [Stutzerimonas stutzeri]
MSNHGSYPAVFGHRQWFAISDNEMIEHPHIDQCQGIAEPAGQLAVSLTRLNDTGWMIVSQDDGCGILCQRALDHLAGVDAGSVDGAVEQRCSSI